MHRQQHEGTKAVIVYGGIFCRKTKGQLYFRFSDQGVSVRLDTPEHVFEAPGHADYLGALVDGLLPQLPGSWLETSHSVRFQPKESEQISLVKITESAKYLPTDHRVIFRLTAHHDGRRISSESGEFELAFNQLTERMSGEFESCYFCRRAAFLSYGGEDLRHDWNCFRDLGIDPTSWERWWDHEEEFRLAMKNTDAFHWCSAFERRPSPR